MTDLVCEYQPWKGGLVHGGQPFFNQKVGMKISAQFLLLDVIPMIISRCQQTKVNQLVIIGHSLGAGTASILTMLLTDLLPDIYEKFKISELKVHCYAFGPPCVASLELAKSYEPWIDSIVLNADLVSGLSFGSLMDWRSMILTASQMLEGSFKEFLAYGVIIAG